MGMPIKHRMSRRMASLLGVALLLPLGSAPAASQGAPNPAEVGKLGPLIPFHKDAIHAGVSWTGGSPKLCFWMRPSEYRGSDLIDPNLGTIGQLRRTFEQLVYGGFRAGTLDRSAATRIRDDIPRDNAQCLDLGHPDALKNTGKFNVAELTAADFALNAAAFSNAGHSAGLNYNLFCAGQTVLADGRWVVVGGHDKGGNNGIRKINIFDPATQTWLDRGVPPVKADFLADPTGSQDPPNANPLNEVNPDPPLPSEMKYQRWYPTTVTLPDDRVLILSGSDQDTSVGPRNAAGTKVRQAVPEVYDPKTDTTIALENAPKLLPMYPRAYVVQTGPGKDEWKVAVTAEVQPPLPTGEALRAYDPFEYNGNTYLLDVLGALADPKRDVPPDPGAPAKHWELVATALASHDSGAGAALWTLDGKGEARSQQVALFGGDRVATVEMIDFAARDPEWVRQDDLLQPVTQNNAVVLPDGQVVVLGGQAGGRGEPEINNYLYQMFNPKSGKIKPLVATTVPRHDHSTALLLPDGTVIAMGGNREELTPGNPDAGVPVAQLYYPPYLFKGPRPVIKEAPTDISYGQPFEVEVSGGAGQIESVVLIRMGPITHNWDWGNRSVKLAVDQAGGGKLVVKAPARPGLAIPGYYMLFAVNEKGVPSVATATHLR